MPEIRRVGNDRSGARLLCVLRARNGNVGARVADMRDYRHPSLHLRHREFQQLLELVVPQAHVLASRHRHRQRIGAIAQVKFDEFGVGIDQRLGDVFAARIAGNFVNTDIIGSLEFATKLAGAKVIVVLGHTGCGAIKGAVDGAKLGNLTAMLQNFAPALAATAGVEGERNSKNYKLVQAVADSNVVIAAKQLVERSDVLRELVEGKALKIVSAMHDIETGKVTFSA